MAFDARRNVVVPFGGDSASSTYASDT